jgi:tRNA G18 (ribose-2'-O)-methylase SpoU
VSTDSHNPHRLVLRGKEAVLACIKLHPKSLREIHASAKFVAELSPHIIEQESQGVKFRTSSPEDMSHLCQTLCQDMCAITQRPDPAHVRVADFAEWREKQETVVIADHVSDPQQLAAIARAMRAFGLQRLLLSSGSEKILFDPEVWFLAQGAMESIRPMRAAALGGLLKLVKDKCCVVGVSPNLGRKIDLGTPVRVPGRHLALLLTPREVDSDLQPRVEHLYRYPGLSDFPSLNLADVAPVAMAWIASTPKPRSDGFMARKKARHLKSKNP